MVGRERERKLGFTGISRANRGNKEDCGKGAPTGNGKLLFTIRNGNMPGSLFSLITSIPMRHFHAFLALPSQFSLAAVRND